MGSYNKHLPPSKELNMRHIRLKGTTVHTYSSSEHTNIISIADRMLSLLSVSLSVRRFRRTVKDLTDHFFSNFEITSGS